MRTSRSSGAAGKILRRIGLTILALAALLLSTFAISIRTWRTGEMPVPPLPLAQGASFTTPSQRIWIDTDAACGVAWNVDVDDCFALLLLARSSRVPIAGISTVFGNASIEVTERTTRELIAMLGGGTVAPLPVYRGSAGPLDERGLTAAAPAHDALRAALEAGPLTIVALGPLTNIAMSLKDRTDLQAKVTCLVIVMGHRPQHLFHPAEGKGRGGILFGHGPVFRDFNFAQDRIAARSLMEMRLRVFLVPYDAARDITLSADDLDRMTAAGSGVRWVASQSRGWLDYWDKNIGLSGFYPFDLVAAAYVTNPRLFDCAKVKAWIAPDSGLLSGLYTPLSLLVGTDSERPKDVRASGEAVYCPQVDPALHRWLMERLVGQ